jgi:hypothetical protein
MTLRRHRHARTRQIGKARKPPDSAVRPGRPERRVCADSGPPCGHLLPAGFDPEEPFLATPADRRVPCEAAIRGGFFSSRQPPRFVDHAKSLPPAAAQSGILIGGFAAPTKRRLDVTTAGAPPGICASSAEVVRLDRMPRYGNAFRANARPRRSTSTRTWRRTPATYRATN